MDLIVKNDGSTQVLTAFHNSNVLGYVAIDSTVSGRSSGGLRLLPDIDETEIQTLALTIPSHPMQSTCCSNGGYYASPTL